MAELSVTSIQKYVTLVRLNPEDTEARLGLAIALEENGESDEAFKEYEQIIRIDPRHARSHLHIGFAYCRGNDTAVALREWQRAYELDPHIYKVYEDPANKNFYAKRIEEALATIEKPTLLRQDDPWAHYQLAMAYRYFNKKELALSHLKKCIDLNPKLWEALNVAGEIYAELDLYQFAKLYYQKAIDINPKFSDTYYNLGSIYEEEGMVGIAIQKYERALESDPDNSKLLFALGRACLKQGRHKKAIANLQKSVDRNHHNPQTHFLLAKACEEIYKPDFAIREYEKAIEIDPKYAEAHYNLGVIHMQMGTPDKAIAHLEECLRINPADSYAHYHLGTAFDKIGNYERAINHFYNALTLNPKDGYTSYNLGLIYSKTERFEDAIREYKKALNILPNESSIHFNLGQAYLAVSDCSNAIEAFNKTIELRPTDFDSHYALAKAYIADEKYDIAIQQLKRTSQYKEDYAEVYYDIGRCFYKMDEIDYAFEQFQKAIKMDAKHIKSKYSIGLIYSYNKMKPDIAIDFYTQALEIDPNFLPAIVEKGYSYLKLRKINEAIEEFEKGRLINPDDTDLIIGFAEALVASKEFESAEKEFKKVITIDPENARARGKYAKALAEAENMSAAIEQYEKATSLDPENQEYAFELTDLFLKLGMENQAKTSLSNYLQTDPENENIQRALETLFELSGKDITGYTVSTLMGEQEQKQESISVEPVDVKAEESEAVRPVKKADDGIIKPKERLAKKPALSIRKGLTGEGQGQQEIKRDTSFLEPESQAAILYAQAKEELARGNFDAALSLFQQVIDIEPSFYRAYVPLTELTNRMGYKSRTKTLLETAVKLARQAGDTQYVELIKKRIDSLLIEEQAEIKQDELISSYTDNAEEEHHTIEAAIAESAEEPPALKARDTGEIQPMPEAIAQLDMFDEPGESIIEDTGKSNVQPQENIITDEEPVVPQAGTTSDELAGLTDEEINDRVELITDFMNLKKFDRARINIEKLFTEAPNFVDAYLLLAKLNKEEENWVSFVNNLEKYIELSRSKDSEYLLKLAEGLEKIGQIHKALKILEQLIEEEPDDVNILEKTVVLLLQGSMFNESIPYLQKLTRKKPEDPRYIFHLARAYRNIERYSLSTVQYQKVLNLTKAPEIYNELGYTYEKLGKTKSAINTYKMTLEIDPGNITANLSLILLYEKVRDYSNALSIINNIIDSDKLSPDRAVVLRKKLEELEKIKETSGDEPVLFDEEENETGELHEKEEEDFTSAYNYNVEDLYRYNKDPKEDSSTITEAVPEENIDITEEAAEQSAPASSGIIVTDVQQAEQEPAATAYIAPLPTKMLELGTTLFPEHKILLGNTSANIDTFDEPETQTKGEESETPKPENADEYEDEDMPENQIDSLSDDSTPDSSQGKMKKKNKVTKQKKLKNHKK